MSERYHRVHQRGYRAASDDITEAVVKLLERGGSLHPGQGTGWRLIVKEPGWVASLDDLSALVPWNAHREKMR